MNNILKHEIFTSVDKMYKDYLLNMGDLHSIISSNPQLLSMRSEYTDLVRKVLVITAANAFERHLVEYLPLVFSKKDTLLFHFLDKQALSRKYHTLFSWEKNNANSFYSLFGEGFKNIMAHELANSEELKMGEKNFLLLGNERNKIAHRGVKFAEFDRDVESVYELYSSALKFYCFLCHQLKICYS